MKKILWVLFISALFSGCFFPHHVIIRYEVYQELSGNMSFELSGPISPGNEESETALDEILKAKDSLCHFTELFGLKNFNSSLEMNESDAKLNISLQFDNFPVVLGVLFDRGSEMKRTKNTFSFKCPFEFGVDLERSVDVQLRLLYHGKVISHNGTLDKSTGEIVWTAGKRKTVRFTLKTAD